jgi:hypothetical protein
LVAEDFNRTLLEAALIAGTKHGMQKNVIGFEGSIGFQLATPPAILMLAGKEKILRRMDGVLEPRTQA